MSKMKLETLTPLHIGSGNVLQKGCDFVCGKNAEDKSFVGIIDPRKVLALIGEENVGAWTAGIENGRGTDDIVRQYAPNAKIADYSRRLIDSYMPQLREPQQIKEFIRDGLGRPYIPGSSIKGAIRTAVLADIAAKMNHKELILRDDRNNITAKSMEDKVFGKNPNYDVFRYLRVVDAIVADCHTAVYNMVNINDREEQSFWDTSKQMATEVLPCGTNVDVVLALKQPSPQLGSTAPFPKALSSIRQLLETINNHTKRVLEKEIKLCKEEKKDVDEEAEAKVDKYILRLCKLLEQVNGCEGTRSAIMRMGHGSGWRFITGAWAALFSDKDWNAVINVSRPGNNKKYSGYIFPKSRRLKEDECEPLGFVKLTLIE